MKVMDRPMTVPNFEPVGRSDRRGDPGLGMANGGFQRFAFGKVGSDGG
jgi:hypothetical protein